MGAPQNTFACDAHQNGRRVDVDIRYGIQQNSQPTAVQTWASSVFLSQEKQQERSAGMFLTVITGKSSIAPDCAGRRRRGLALHDICPPLLRPVASAYCAPWSQVPALHLLLLASPHHALLPTGQQIQSAQELAQAAGLGSLPPLAPGRALEASPEDLCRQLRQSRHPRRLCLPWLEPARPAWGQLHCWRRSSPRRSAPSATGSPPLLARRQAPACSFVASRPSLDMCRGPCSRHAHPGFRVHLRTQLNLFVWGLRKQRQTWATGRLGPDMKPSYPNHIGTVQQKPRTTAESENLCANQSWRLVDTFVETREPGTTLSVL